MGGGSSTSNETKHPKDTVILHQIGRGPYAPSLIPFAMKLETYLRMAKIPYQNAHSLKTSSKGKWPWIEFNGQALADSGFIIKFLNKHFNVNLNANLSEEEKAAAHAIRRMVEENTYWSDFLLSLKYIDRSGFLTRWVYDKDLVAIPYYGIPKPIGWVISKSMKKRAVAHGIGRHTKEEVYEIMREDYTALSKFLGNKQFLLGDRPCEEDCAIFGYLAQAYWHGFGQEPETALKEFPNLCSYCERMKNTFWPDWEECNTDGGKRTATK
ncbi:hypothetical protein FSP39_019144 [Pinctada imbricata]|uniref:Failed axon connections-like protein n=1 Tax=Pinctada imbricata TaxID=66713 RepID=A0AA88XWA4_PINIB|nr:hypothetical protein FSP39_019144 [Pinctada imbricata]